MYENIKDKLFKCFNKLVQRKSISLAKIFSLFTNWNEYEICKKNMLGVYSFISQYVYKKLYEHFMRNFFNIILTIFCPISNL